MLKVLKILSNPYIIKKDLIKHPFYELKRAQLERAVEEARPFFTTPEAEGLKVFLERKEKYHKALDKYNAYVRN